MFETSNPAILRLQQHLSIAGLAMRLLATVQSAAQGKITLVEIHRGALPICEAMIRPLGDDGYQLYIEAPSVFVSEDVELIVALENQYLPQLPLEPTAA